MVKKNAAVNSARSHEWLNRSFPRTREPSALQHDWQSLALDPRFRGDERSIYRPERIMNTYFFFVVERHGVKLEPVVDQPVAELARDLGLQPLDLLRGEFDHLAVAQIDQVVVMRFRAGLVAGAAVAEIVALDDAGVLEQAHGAVDGGNGDAVVDLDAAPVELLDVGVVVGGRQHARDDAALLGHAHALGGAKRLDICPVRQAFFRCGHCPGLPFLTIAQD